MVLVNSAHIEMLPRYVVKGCQMLSRRTKNYFYFINIGDTVTNVLPLCSVYKVSSYEPNLTLLGWYLSEFAYLSMLFIPEVVYIEGSADHLKNKQHAQISKLSGKWC